MVFSISFGPRLTAALPLRTHRPATQPPTLRAYSRGLRAPADVLGGDRVKPEVFEGSERTGLHLVTFGGGNPGIRRAAQRLGREAEKTHWFTNVVVLHEEHLTTMDPNFFDSRARLFNGDSRGFGYWCWKPAILHHYLSESSLNAHAVMFLDAGCHLNDTAQSLQRLHEYERIAASTGNVFFALREHSQGDWISSETAAYLGMTEEASQLPQVVSGSFILRNDDDNRKLVNSWLELSQVDDGQLLMGGSENHRHDQSLLSHLVYEAGLDPLPDETWSEDWGTMSVFPIWTARNRTGFRYRPLASWNRLNRLFERARGRLVSAAPSGR